MGLLGAVGGVIGGLGANRAGKTLAAGYDQAAGIYKDQYDKDRPLFNPYIEAGTNALSDIAGRRDWLNQQFTTQDIYSDPSYRFRFNQGMRGAQAAAQAAGGYGGGNSLRALTDYGQNAASQEYQNAFNRFQADRNNYLSRQNVLLNQGQFGTSGAVNLGQKLGETLANFRIGSAGARASGIQGLYSGIGGGLASLSGGMMPSGSGGSGGYQSGPFGSFW